MSLTPNSVFFEELEGSPKIKIDQNGVSATRILRVNWSDWQEVAYELIGKWAVIGANAQWYPPIAFPGLGNLVVDSLDIEPFEPSSPDGTTFVDLGSATNSYPAGARITASYKTLQIELVRPDMPQVPNGTYLNFTGDNGAEITTVPGRALKWLENVANGESPILPEDAESGFITPTGNYTLSWCRVPAPPWNALRNLRGHVNASTWLGAPPETVMYQGFSFRRQFQLVESDGVFWDIDMRFAEKCNGPNGDKGWNHQYKKGSGWSRVGDESSGDPLFQLDDFLQLFVFDLSLLV